MVSRPPDYTAHAGRRGIPTPHRYRKIEGGNNADRTPRGCHCSIKRWPGRSDAMVNPWSWRERPVAKSQMSIISCTSPSDSAMILPVSMVTSSARSLSRRGARCRVAAPGRRERVLERSAISKMPKRPSTPPLRNRPLWLCAPSPRHRPSIGDTFSDRRSAAEPLAAEHAGILVFHPSLWSKEFMLPFSRGRATRSTLLAQQGHRGFNGFRSNVQHRPKANGFFAAADREQSRFEKPFRTFSRVCASGRSKARIRPRPRTPLITGSSARSCCQLAQKHATHRGRIVDQVSLPRSLAGNASSAPCR